MPDLCEAPWRRRCSSSTFCDVVAFRGEHLALGLETVLYKLGVESSGTSSLRSDEAAYDRMVALLAVAGHGRLAEAGLAQLATALGDWRRGDRGLAAIRLALAPLPRLRDRDDAHRLFLAETALDAGLAPAALLAELGYAACVPLLKFDPNQPRVPAGSGEQSGRWTSGGAGGGAAGTASGPAPREPAHADAEGLRPTLVLYPDGPQDRERTSPDAEWRRLDIGGDEKLRIEEGRPILPQTAAPGAPVPLPRSEAPTAGAATGAGSSGLAIPEPGITPIPRLQSAPVGPDPATTTPKSRDDKGSVCPAQQDDIPRGPDPSGDENEYKMSLLINPENPTPKKSMATPSVKSQAYFLPADTPTGRISYDDCKQGTTPTPIPELQPGDMIEYKTAGWGWVLFNDWSNGYTQFMDQVKNQDAAVVSEGRGRQVYYCLGSRANANQAFRILDNKYKSSHFLACI